MLGTGIRFNQKPRSPVQKCGLKKVIFDLDVIVKSRSPYDTHFGMVINCAEFVVCAPGCFGEVKIDKHTDRIGLYILDYDKDFYLRIYFLASDQSDHTIVNDVMSVIWALGQSVDSYYHKPASGLEKCIASDQRLVMG